jgi:hypothetical protein
LGLDLGMGMSEDFWLARRYIFFLKSLKIDRSGRLLYIVTGEEED